MLYELYDTASGEVHDIREMIEQEAQERNEQIRAGGDSLRWIEADDLRAPAVL